MIILNNFKAEFLREAIRIGRELYNIDKDDDGMLEKQVAMISNGNVHETSRFLNFYFQNLDKYPNSNQSLHSYIYDRCAKVFDDERYRQQIWPCVCDICEN